MKSLKSKLVLTLSLFVVLILIVVSVIQIREKEREITNDIFMKVRNLAKLASEKLVEDYKLYLEPKSFVFFQRELAKVLAKSEEVKNLRVVDYNGVILFDLEIEKERQYEGEQRLLKDLDLLEQIKSQFVSVKLEGENRVVYLDESSGKDRFLDFNGDDVGGLRKDQKFQYLVQPVNNQFAVIYDFSYKSLQERVIFSLIRVLIVVGFSVSFGILLALLLSSSIIRPIKKLKDGADEIAKGNFAARVEINSKDELKMLANSFNKMAIDLDNSMKALLYKERVAKELELAIKIQQQILPKKIPNFPGVDFAAGLIPAEEIGGDLYDFLKVDEKNIVFYLGDVTGHGVPSGILGAIANSLLFSNVGKRDLKSILIDVNMVFKEKTTANMFMTMVMLHWNAESEVLKYLSAGHEQIIHYKARSKKVELLPGGGLALGMIKDISKLLNEREINWEEGDVIVIYSDGIPEAWRNEKEMYGMERFLKVVEGFGELKSALAIRNSILADVYNYRKNYKQMDDITLLVAKKL